MQDLASVFNAEVSQAHDINNTGVIAAWAGMSGHPHAFRYDSRALTAPEDLGVLPGHNQSYAFAINDKGQVTGISIGPVPPHSHAFLHDGGMVDLGPAVSALDINEAGQVVGARFVDGASEWTAYVCETSIKPPQFQDLGPLPLPRFVSSEAMGINNQGDIVGYSSTNFVPGQLFMVRAWVRPAGGPMQDLNSLIPPGSGWLLVRASAINDKGQIAGTGIYGGEYRAYLLTPAPVPSSFKWPWPINAVIERLGRIFS